MTLATRADGPELMDADDLDAGTYADVVADLARVNSVTLAARPTMRFLAQVARGRERLRILDVGFGDGDMLRRIERWAARRGIAVELIGVDLNPRSEIAARAHTPGESRIRWITGDYRDQRDQPWDVVISSLVAHHMTRDQLVAFVRFMEAHAAAGWFVNDLLRHGFAHRAFPLLARIARWHPIVRHDGTLSIARSFRAAEWTPILAEAGVSDARVFRAFPFRLCVERRR
jgi:2-polyprenyl-3-methyl-5-hydroxy-6-metoxy-1,4-benzoquinol methylase